METYLMETEELFDLLQVDQKLGIKEVHDWMDLFANLRPNMTRYTTIDEVNAAILQLEEREHASSGDKVSIERHSDSKPPSRSSSGVISSNGKSAAKDIGENGEAHGEESDSDSGSGSVVKMKI